MFVRILKETKGENTYINPSTKRQDAFSINISANFTGIHT